MAKIGIILYCPRFNRMSKVLPAYGPLKDWDYKTRSFKTSTSEYADKNKILFETKNKFPEVAEQWEKKVKLEVTGLVFGLTKRRRFTVAARDNVQLHLKYIAKNERPPIIRQARSGPQAGCIGPLHLRLKVLLPGRS